MPFHIRQLVKSLPFHLYRPLQGVPPSPPSPGSEVPEYSCSCSRFIVTYLSNHLSNLHAFYLSLLLSTDFSDENDSFLVNLGSSSKNLGMSPFQERPLQFLVHKAEECDTGRNETREMSRPKKPCFTCSKLR